MSHAACLSAAIGVAGFLTPTITGAGIAAAIASGELAGEAAVRYLQKGHAQAFTDYESEIRERYAPSLQRALERRALFDAYRQSTISAAQQRQTWIAFPEYYGATSAVQ